MHSFSITEHYIILTEYPFIVDPLDLIMNGKAFIKNFVWEPTRGTRFVIINRKNGTVASTCVTKPFFAFHHVNAFEKDGIINIDIVTHKDASIIEVNKVDMLPCVDRCLERFSVSLETATITSQILLNECIEFPRINEMFDGRAYNYIYMTEFANYFKSIGIYKINTETRDILKWSEDGCQPGESVFVAAPDAKDEDDGVVLTVISDHIHGNSFLLVLDGKSFQELGRARIPHMIPLGLHGQYYTLQ
jgi:carotenoid cleavage dioxygenase-like enzyme